MSTDTKRMKRIRVGDKVRIPCIGVCRVVGVSHDEQLVILKRGRRRVKASFGFVREMKLSRRMGFCVVFEGWDDSATFSVAHFSYRVAYRGKRT